MDGWHILSLATGAVGLIGAIVALVFMPARNSPTGRGTKNSE